MRDGARLMANGAGPATHSGGQTEPDMSMQHDPKGPWAVAPARGRRAFLGTAAGTALSLGWPLAGAAALPTLRLDHSVTLSRARLDELARTA